MIQENQMDIVRLLVAHGGDLNAVDYNGEHCLALHALSFGKMSWSALGT